MADRVATNVRLSRAQLKELKRLALDRGVSLSALFQELIDDYLARTRALTGKDWKADPFFQLGRSSARSGLSRVAEDHDRYLYPLRAATRPRRRRGQQAVR
jgi:Ribbon-helix-helix protein, copG family